MKRKRNAEIRIGTSQARSHAGRCKNMDGKEKQVVTRCPYSAKAK
jgi:hypothetical protein